MASYGGKLIVAFLVGRLLLQCIALQSAEATIWPLALGIVVYAFVRAINIVGDIVSAVVVLIGLGAVWLLVRQRPQTPAVLEPSRPFDTGYRPAIITIS